MLSYWEQKNFLKYDLLVVGSGFVGLSTAIHFKKKHPKANVAILERGVFPTGASSKNAGFACFGSLTEILDDFWHMTPEEVLGLVERRYKGLVQIRKTFGDKALGYQDSNGFELLDESQIAALERMGEVNQFLKGIFKKKVFSTVKDSGKLGFAPSVKAIVKNKFEGELDPGKYLNNLWKMAGELGVRIITGAEVKQVDSESGEISATDNFSNQSLSFVAKRLAICTNAFTKQLLPTAELEPGRGLVMVSEPLDFEIPWKGSFHMDKGYVYFRKIDGRLLLGGARNVDFEGENSTDFKVNPKIKSHLDQLAKEVIFPGKEFKWEREWTGIMAFGKKKTPIIERISEKTALAVRLGGMGVAVGWQVGKELSALISEK
ncbi:NAD(P)/FAD-dependent oxidoreductase [Algoriphagus pacificus]|uniref:FAD-binding oxidoreductase n=1 Tax=Algoriphagus pacificus TaxID=2811234 RepID=A0ABS3CE97_9BACT|nr:FAD-binding oxidoreductase [Algoriphagus pacificus]MBN7815428.1 FAD-binding oxidoreductase [Algoriphagus pacificus]